MARLTVRVKDMEGNDKEGYYVEVGLLTDELKACVTTDAEALPHVVVPIKIAKKTDSNGSVAFDLPPSDNYEPEATDYEIRIQTKQGPVDNGDFASGYTFTMPTTDTTLNALITGSGS